MSKVSVVRARVRQFLAASWKYVALIVGVVGAISIGIYSDLNKSEWAAWVQAIGAIVAIFAAIWITSKEDARRREEMRAAARLTAAGLTMRLAADAASLRHEEKKFAAWAKMDFNPGGIPDCLAELQRIGTYSLSDLLPLVPLEKNAGYKLAGAYDRVNAGIFFLSKFQNSGKTHLSDERKKAAEFISFVLNEACDLFDQAVSELQKESLAYTSRFEHALHAKEKK